MRAERNVEKGTFNKLDYNSSHPSKRSAIYLIDGRVRRGLGSQFPGPGCDDAQLLCFGHL